MVKIEHVQQVNDGFNWKCGAACLEMIFKYYGIECNQDEIWEKIKTRRGNSEDQYYAFTKDVAKYAIEHGLHATIYKSDEQGWKYLLEKIDEFNIPIVMSVKEQASGDSHFVVYLGKKKRKFIFADPNTAEKTSTYSYWDVDEMWKPHLEINVTGYIYIVFEGDLEWHNCQTCGNRIPILTKNRELFSGRVICPYCDYFIK